MLHLFKFDGQSSFLFPNGAIASPAAIREQFPAVNSFLHVLEINGDVCQAVESLAALRELYHIDSSLSEDDAIAAIETIINTPPEPVPSAEERIAAALEFSNITSLPDIQRR